MMRWLSVQMTEDGARFIEGVWAIFGHGSNIFVYRAASANGAWMEPR